MNKIYAIKIIANRRVLREIKKAISSPEFLFIYDSEGTYGDIGNGYAKFVPIVGAINDAAQIVHGMITGYDYTGKRMTLADYALRGVGVIAGTVGFGNFSSHRLQPQLFL